MNVNIFLISFAKIVHLSFRLLAGFIGVEMIYLKTVFFFLMLVLNLSVLGQVAYQGFEQNAGDTWPVNFSTPPCTSGSDQWDYEPGTLGGISANAGAQFWGIQDLDGGCGSSTFETITTSAYDVSACSGVTVSFDYNCVGYDAGDDIKYQMVYDGIPQAEIVVINGTSNLSTPGWVTENINVPGGTNTVQIIISVKQNGGSDYAGIDNIILDGSCVSCSPDTEPTTQASNSNVNNIDCYSADLSWTNGNGDNTLVVLSDNPISGSPSDLSGYTASTSYGGGSNISGNEYVVFDGNGSNVSIAGLSHTTTYYYAIYTYNVTTPNCDENYLTSSVETGSFTTATCVNTCPYISGIMFNSCGSTEGTDEYFTMQTGSDPVNIDDIIIDFPNQQYCNSGCLDGGLINNPTYVNDLNTTAGCSPDLFVYADPIPPNSTVMVFTGNPPSTVLDFSSNCAAAPVYVIFTDNASTSGRFSNSGVRDLTVDWGGSCGPQTVTYDGSQASSDGGTVLYDETGTPSATYSTSIGCVYPLPIELISFTVNNKDEKALVKWVTASETRISHYQVYQSTDGEQWKLFTEVDAIGNASSTNQYEVIDPSPNIGINYYRLNVVDQDGYYPEVGIRSIEFNSSNDQINAFQKHGNLVIQSNFEVSKNTVIAIYDISGKVIYSTQGDGSFEQTIPLYKIQTGVYVVNLLKSNGATYRQKVILNK